MTSKERIFTEAASLFQEKGYKAASIRDLAERVGLQPSSIYSHIRSKEEILQKICFDNANAFLNGMRQVEQSETTAEAQVRSLLLLHMQTALNQATSATVFNDEWRHLQEPFLSDFLQMRKDYESRFITILKKGVADGSFRKLNPDVTLNTLLSSIRWLHDWQRKPRNITKSKLQQDMLDLLMSAILV